MRFNPTAKGIVLTLAAIAWAADGASAQTLKATKVMGGFTNPIFVCAPPGDTTRLFVVQQGGRVRLIKNGVLLGTDYATFGAAGLALITSGGERGLLGMAFHPDYANNGFVYFNYTNTSGNTVVARYTSNPSGDTMNTATGATIIGPISQPQSNHNGGCIQFGGDGMLYIAMGDGGNFNDTGTGHAAGGNAQSNATLLGKMLRLDVDLPFPHIPATNPYFGGGAPLDEIWHFGLRNPWRFSFDSLTGDMYIGDVGQDAVEEVSFQAAGVSALNFGWRCMEGNSCTGLTGCTCNDPVLTDPIDDYPQSPGGHCAVTGGYVYRGCAIPGLDGTYFYADYCSSAIWSFEYVGGVVTNFTTRTTELEPAGTDTISSISSFGTDALGEIYICDYSDGEIYRIDDASVAPADCNGNTVPDACDIALGNSQDVNGNNIPDECDCIGGVAPFTYCTAKLNSQFCLPEIGFTGMPQVGAQTPFSITATQILNNKQGLMFYGFGAVAQNFQGGFKCAASPTTRTPVQASGGSPTGDDCTGTFTYEFMARILSGVDPMLVPGQQVNCQYWSRDPQDPFTTNLTDGVQFTICN